MKGKNLGKIFAAMVIVAMLSTAIGTQFVATASAAVTVQQIAGTLGGADFLIRIPSNWQGDLIVFCRGHSRSLSEVNLVTQANMWNGLINTGVAFAMSDFGVGGWCIKEGIIRTHQLTEYIINNYQISGKVILVGASMGGDIALELGAKYPDLYDGVLDMFGVKNMITHYEKAEYFGSLTNDADLVNALIERGIPVPPYPFSLIAAPLSVQLAALRADAIISTEEKVLAFGGTPDEKPKAYERVSPTFSSSDISIPTITLHGTADGMVSYQQSLEFKDAVAAAGHANLYRLYTVTGGQHGDAKVLAKVPTCTAILMNWVKNNVPAPQVQPWST